MLTMGNVKQVEVDFAGGGYDIPLEFGFENEHPSVSPPYTLHAFGQKFKGQSLSLTTIELGTRDDVLMVPGSRHSVRIQFAFENFDVSIYPDIVVVGENGGTLTMKFVEPTGDHAAQLRFVLNSYISGDFVTLGSVMSYSGPTKPKEVKAAQQQSWVDRYRSIGVACLSGLLALWAASGIYVRYTTGYELHPVMIERSGQPMKATTAGQIAYLNPEAERGEVLFSVNSNSGDVLNFRMPCDCKAVMNQSITEGATVLPDDIIMTILVNSVGLDVKALMSVEGLSRAMKGDHVFLDLADGRSLPVQVVASQTVNAASLRGDPFVPVQLMPPADTISDADIGKFAQLRVTKKLPWKRAE